MTKFRLKINPIVLLADRMTRVADTHRSTMDVNRKVRDAFGPMTDTLRSMTDDNRKVRDALRPKFAFDSFGNGYLRPLHLPQESEFPRARLLSPDNRPPDILEKPKRGRPFGSPDDEYVSFGVDMVLRGEAKNGQEAARTIVDVFGFQQRGWPETECVGGSTHDEAIDRLARKIRQALDRLKTG